MRKGKTVIMLLNFLTVPVLLSKNRILVAQVMTQEVFLPNVVISRMRHRPVKETKSFKILDNALKPPKTANGI